MLLSKPVTLTDESVRLEPLASMHAEDLLAAAADPEIWRYLPRPQPCELAVLQSWIDEALQRASGGMELPFAIIARESGRAVGSTRYLEIRREHRGLEIGWTWLGRNVQRSALNTRCKRLLLAHAFDELGALRVQLKTDARNLRSQVAIERIGARREGVLRQHMVLWDGFVRDTVMYSVVREEWPEVRARLDELLERGSGPAS